MASASATTLSLCSSLTTQCKISLHHNPPNPLSKPFLLPKPLLGSSSKTHHKLVSSSPLLTGGLPTTFLRTPPKVSEFEAPAVESEPSTTESVAEPVSIADVSKEVPKREEVFAVVMIGSRQYIVFPGRFIYVQRLKGANVNDKVTLNKVLLVGTRAATYIGKPIVTNAAVHAVVEEQGLNPKVVVFKYKKKKHYQRNIGHRQPNTRIRITAITGYQDYPASTLES